MPKPKVTFSLRSSGNFTCPEGEYSEETTELFIPEYKTGRLIFVEDTGQIYLDYHNRRICFGENPQWVNDVES